MGVTSTPDFTGRQLPLVTGPVGELGVGGWTHAALAREGEPHSFGVPFAMQLRKQESKT